MDNCDGSDQLASQKPVDLDLHCYKTEYTVKPAFSGYSKEDLSMVSKTGYSLMQVNVLQNALLEHSAILLTCIKLLPVFKTFSPYFKWPLKTD